jgi:FKBP-type peptidyl-prolyl cis-trans isomerase (trigger factor)
LKLSAINNISAALITEQLFDKYKITVTQKEVDEFIENLANEYGYDIKTTKEKLRNDFSYIESLSAHRKLLDYLIVKCSKHKPK